MRKSIALFVLTIALACGNAEAPTAPVISTVPTVQTDEAVSPPSNPFDDVRLVRVYDGDTAFFQLSGLPPVLGGGSDGIGVRVKGIDAPEMRTSDSCEKDRAEEARALAVSLLESARRIDLKDVERDKYFRLLAVVRFDGVSLADTLLSAGLVVPYDGGTKPEVDWCAD